MGGRDEFVELLERAGLEVVGDRVVEEVLPPPAAWRRVIRWEAEPTVTVEADRPDAEAGPGRSGVDAGPGGATEPGHQ
ncbi:hypothetical protein [Streptomyces sp. NPDC001843]|uniref:hypothetical protein n=1 Tax=Streptomyces sp. NPDC001843 TaxID=3364617 RepID=UPI003683B318